VCAPNTQGGLVGWLGCATRITWRSDLFDLVLARTQELTCCQPLERDPHYSHDDEHRDQPGSAR
jgi:hypothetical protein